MTELTTYPGKRLRAQSVFERLAGWSYRWRWGAILAWIAVLAGVTALSQAVGSDYDNDHSLPGTESQQALDTLEGHGSPSANDSVTVVLEHPEGLAEPATEARVAAMLSELAALPGVQAVASPYASEHTISAAGTIGYATVTLDGRTASVPQDQITGIIDTAQAAEGGGLRVELGGDAIRGVVEAQSEGPPAEAAGILAALLILVVMFGSLLAASLPIIIAIFAVSSTIGLIVLASHLTTVADYTPPVMVLVGLGVGIDYALLVFARFRGELISGAGREPAIRTALDTAGRTVFFAGCTVMIALLGLVLLGLSSMQGMAVAVALTVLMTMLASLTLLPALLAIFGRRIERRVRRRAQRLARRRAARDHARATGGGTGEGGKSEAGGGEGEGDGWRRWTALVQRRAWPAALLPAVGLLALAGPALGLHLGFADAGNDPAGATSRAAYDLLAEGFGPGFNGPLVVVATGEQPVAGTVAPLTRTLGQTPGVAAVFPAGEPRGGVATLIVIPQTAPQSAQTTELVDRLRSEVLPAVERETGTTVLVGGVTAAAVDFADAVAARLPWFVAAVVGLSALLLMVVFRSVLIPLKAAALNLLSVGASLGVMTLVFQHGFLSGPLGIEPGPIEAFVPVMIFAIVFGLSMDYEIFLLSRMHEAWERDRDPRLAIREGLATTGRVVTAAAAIMIVVFGAFLLSPDRMLKQFGLGLAVAILVDAVIIRCLVLPAVMELLGRRAWWLPRRLARLLPRVALEHQ